MPDNTGMAVAQTSIGTGFNLHVSYMDPPPAQSGPISISVSNPDVATVESDPVHPGDPAYAIIMPMKFGEYVVAADDGVFHAALPEFQAVEPGTVQNLPDQQLILGM